MRKPLAIHKQLLLAALCVCSSALMAAMPNKPNVLLILLDDAGYSDVAGFGRDDAPTPNIRQIAAEGVRFTRHYADSTCRPARLALLTGREAARVAQNPDFRGISPDTPTLARTLKAAGYHTVHIGKWHLGDAVRDAWPDKQGFDQWFGFLNQFQLKGPDANGAFTKRPTYIDPWLQSDHAPLQQYRGHLEDILAERVVAAIKNGAAIKKDATQTPWFINYWLFAPHHPSTASDEFLKKFPATPEGKYRALLAQADAEIGKAIQALRETQQLDNTLIIIASDNGGTNQMLNNNFPFAGVKGQFREGSLRTPLIIRWPDRRSAGKTIDEIVAIQDIFPTVLAATGLAPVAPVDGYNLQPLLNGEKLPARPLIHEIGSSGLFNYSLLSANGRWRASPNELYDLHRDSSGATNIAAAASTQLRSMEAAYNQWRNQKIAVPIVYQAITAQGQATLTGSDFLRAPGYGAYSFVIGGTLPTDNAEPVYLAQQAGIWSLTYQPDHRFTVQIGKDILHSKPLQQLSDKTACVPITLSAFYTRSRLHAQHNSARVTLHVANQPLLQWETSNPEEIDGNFSAATWIGQNAQGTQRWGGQLRQPHIYNAALHDDTSSAIDQRIAAEKLACADAQPTGR